MRKNYIDNLRWMLILLLFPYHTAMIYNDFGENFYIRGPAIPAVSAFILAAYAWFMPLLFVLAGMSTNLSLQKRTVKQYVTERCHKLLIPLFFGIIFLIPVQTYFAERFHNGYCGSYFQQYVLFFTKETDLTGYTGGFTPAHLWFILYLFVISLITLPIILKYQHARRKLHVEKYSIPKLLPMFLFPLVMAPILNVGDKSVGEDFALFLLGYFVLSNDTVIARLEKRRLPLLFSSILLISGEITLHFHKSWYTWIPGDVFQRLVMWVCILAFLGMAKHYFDFRTDRTAYLAKASFPIYILHQTILVSVAYFAFQWSSIPLMQIMIILPITVALTFAAYELLRRIPGIRWMLGIKP